MSDELKVGDKAPDFSLPSATGQTITPKSLRGKQVVLYFYPKDDTPGCTKEACSFRDEITLIEKAHTVVLGVHTDVLASLPTFSKQYVWPFEMITHDCKRH